MSRNELEGTTSRAVLIRGMTDTGEVGMWQAASVPRSGTAEVLPDAGDGAEPADEGGGEERNENGLTAEEQQAFDGMRTGDTPAGEAPEAEEEGEPEPGEVHEPGEAPPQQREPGDKVADPAQPQQKPPKTVNYSKYKREIDRANQARQTVEQALAKEREDRIKLSARVELINEALSQKPPPQQEEQQPPLNPFAEQDVDPNEDFAGAIAQINRRQRYQLESQQEVQETIIESREDSQMKDTFTRDFTAYSQKDPSIIGAYQHLKDARLTQICLGEFGKDPNDPNEQFTPQEVQRMVQMFNNEEKWLVGKAIKERRSPAAAIVAMARTFGFDAAAWKAAQMGQRAQPAAPAARQQVPARQPQRAPAAPQGDPNAMEMLEQLRQNRENGKSLSDGGGAPPQGLTAQMLLALDDEQFAEMVDSMSEYQLNSLMGRQSIGGQ